MPIDRPNWDDDGDPPDDPALEALAIAILDGAPVDWQKASHDSDPELLHALQVLSDLTALHRSLTPSGASDAPLDEELRPVQGVRWGPLTLQELIGHGAFGEVYRAWDPRLDRDVALKLLRRRESQQDALGSHVIDEGRLLARVRHPNVVTVYGADRIDGRVGLWMELIRGRTLAQWLRDEGPVSPQDAASIGRDLCGALAAVHRTGLHRDVKAQNVMREDGGRIVLMDFGTSQLVTEGEPVKNLAGTPLYVAPEVLAGRPATEQSDVYSLGVLLYHLVTGTYPLRGANLEEIRHAHRTQQPARLRDERPDLPADFIKVVEHALEPDPSRRFRNAEEFGKALNELLVAPQELPPPGRRLGRTGWGVAAAAVVLAAVGGIWIATYAELKPAVLPSVAPPVTQVRTSTPPQSLGQPSASGLFPPAEPAVSELHRPTPSPSLGQPRADEGFPPGNQGVTQMRFPMAPQSIGQPSADGRFWPLVGARGVLQIFDAQTHQFRQLVSTGWSRPSSSSLMSPAGDQVAFEFFGAEGLVRELRIVRADGTALRILVPGQTTFDPVPVAWSKDGKAILCWFLQRNGTTADLMLVPIDAGRPRVIWTSPVQPRVPAASVSPDGRFVAFDSQGDLWVAPIDDSSVAPKRLLTAVVVQHALWTPDGERIVFMRETPDAAVKGTLEFSYQRIKDGEPVGDPVTLLANIGNARPAVITATSALIYVHPIDRSRTAEVYVMPVDLSGGSPAGTPVRIDPASFGGHGGPAFSPDGRSIAYFNKRTTDGLPVNTLAVRRIGTGIEREVPVKITLAGYPPLWSPDSQSVMVFANDSLGDPDRWGWYRVDLNTAASAPVVVGGPFLQGSRDYTDNGRTFVYAHNTRGLMARDVGTGLEQVLVAPAANVLFFSARASSDGRYLAFKRHEGDGRRWVQTVELRASDGRLTPLVRVSSPESVNFLGWIPGSHDLLIAICHPSTRPCPLKRVSANGGDPIDLHLTLPGTDNQDLSPDGRYLAYEDNSPGWELWINRELLAPQ